MMLNPASDPRDATVLKAEPTKHPLWRKMFDKLSGEDKQAEELCGYRIIESLRSSVPFVNMFDRTLKELERKAREALRER